MTQEVEVPDEKPQQYQDSNWQYQYYAEHYWDNCDFNDNAMIYTPVFAPDWLNITRMLFILPLIPSLNTQIFLSKNQKQLRHI